MWQISNKYIRYVIILYLCFFCLLFFFGKTKGNNWDIIHKRDLWISINDNAGVSKYIKTSSDQKKGWSLELRKNIRQKKREVVLFDIVALNYSESVIYGITSNSQYFIYNLTNNSSGTNLYIFDSENVWKDWLNQIPVKIQELIILDDIIHRMPDKELHPWHYEIASGLCNLKDSEWFLLLSFFSFAANLFIGLVKVTDLWLFRLFDTLYLFAIVYLFYYFTTYSLSPFVFLIIVSYLLYRLGLMFKVRGKLMGN